MTKERRLAIEMWEQIVDVLENGTPGKCYLPVINTIKEDFCRAHNLEWKYCCWFCQYVRRDWRPDLPSREGIPKYRNGCQRCPLYKERADIFDANGDECGCIDLKETLWKQVTDDYNVYAARRILELLKGVKKNDDYSSDASAF